MGRILRADWLPVNRAMGLLWLRVTAMGSLFIKHGWEKITTFSAMAQHFPDPLHIGPVPSLLFALLADSICSVLIIFGVATRWAAAIGIINIFVAWAFVHHFQFLGKGGGADHGEVIVLYLIVLVTLLIAGPGRYSVDERIGRG